MKSCLLVILKVRETGPETEVNRQTERGLGRDREKRMKKQCKLKLFYGQETSSSLERHFLYMFCSFSLKGKHKIYLKK